MTPHERQQALLITLAHVGAQHGANHQPDEEDE